MLQYDATKQSALVIVRQYVKKRELTQKFETIMEILIENDSLREEVAEKLQHTLLKQKLQNQRSSLIGNLD
jgi:hypothetical protein